METADKDIPTTPCPANELPKEQKDMMWFFFMQGGQKSNIPALKEYVNDLIHATTQKTAGQRKAHSHAADVCWDDLDNIMWGIIIEATALVLSGDLDKLELNAHTEVEVKENGDTQM